jgi:hypothetical protein
MKKSILPERFIQFWKELQAKHGSLHLAHVRLIIAWMEWRRGDHNWAIPGYAIPPGPMRGTGLPYAWSLGNLSRFRLTTAEQTICRRTP